MDERVKSILSQVNSHGRLLQEKKYIQHGDVSVYQHSINVACISTYLADYFKADIDYDSLIRGALLHDYFLYDWHDGAKWHRLHGFRHGKFALRNAQEDFQLTGIEKDIILNHMFPLTLKIPVSREAWIVMTADRFCAIYETLNSWKRQKKNVVK